MIYYLRTIWVLLLIRQIVEACSTVYVDALEESIHLVNSGFQLKGEKKKEGDNKMYASNKFKTC